MLSSPSEVYEFGSRWQKARIAALKQSAEVSEIEEVALLRSLPADKRDEALRNVFGNSRKFGQSFSKHYGVVLELADIRALLPKLSITCFSGQWYRRDEALVREKSGCVAGLKLGSFYCDYWREAADGLTMGVSDELLFARHASCRHGDENCIDVWFEERSEQSRQMLKGALPEWAQMRLAGLAEKFKSDGVTLKFEGLSEGVLFCQITSSKAPSCSDEGQWEKIVAREIAQIWPGVKLKNTTPVAVYGEGF